MHRKYYVILCIIRQPLIILYLPLRHSILLVRVLRLNLLWLRYQLICTGIVSWKILAFIISIRKNWRWMYLGRGSWIISRIMKNSHFKLRKESIRKYGQEWLKLINLQEVKPEEKHHMLKLPLQKVKAMWQLMEKIFKTTLEILFIEFRHLNHLLSLILLDFIMCTLGLSGVDKEVKLKQWEML